MVENISNCPIKKRKIDDELSNIVSSRVLNNSDIFTQNHTNDSPISGKKEESNFFVPCNYRNGQILSRFLDRLKLKTIPHVAPLLERMVEAENKNINALKSIDKINKRIKELEFQVEKNIGKSEPVASVAVGTDITDPNSEEYKRIMSAIPSSPFAPTKLRSSQTHKPNQLPCNKDEKVLNFPNTPIYQPTNNTNHNQMIDLTSEEEHKNRALNELFQQPNGGGSGALDSMNSYSNSNNPSTSLIPINNQNIIINSSYQHLPKNNICTNFSSPTLGYKRVKEGICLQWDMNMAAPCPCPTVFNIYSFQKSSNVSKNIFPWKQIGEVEALPLPMACTLTQVVKMSTYFFAVRASINNQTFSPWSNVVLIEIN